MGPTGMKLAESHCRPKAPLLSEDAAASLRAQVSDWKMPDGRKLSKTFLFPDFRAALDFVNRAGAIAEEEGHHPDLHLAWGRVDVTTSTHDAGGLTENDFILAARIDGAFLAR
jgi:4a-hydroxytetrahydrobiopterin dehydratase